MAGHIVTMRRQPGALDRVLSLATIVRIKLPIATVFVIGALLRLRYIAMNSTTHL